LAGDENLAYPRRASAATTAAAEAGGTDTEDPHTGVLGKLDLDCRHRRYGSNRASNCYRLPNIIRMR
jgi:hypothetical protein